MSGREAFASVAVVGAFNTRQARRLSEHTSETLAVEAIRGALADAGIAPGEVDGLVVDLLDRSLVSSYFARQLGGRPCWTGEGLGIAGVLEAAQAIACGLCEVAVVASAQAGIYSDRAATAPWTRPEHEFTACWGLYTAVEFALIARRHMHLYGTTPAQLAAVAATVRTHGARNPAAVMSGGDVSVDDVLGSRMVADPFHLLDCSITSEGGAAIVLASKERAADLDAPSVAILGGALERMGQGYTTIPEWDRHGRVGAAAAARAFGMAGLSPADVDVCEFYDPFSFEVIRQLEVFGFCGEGEGGAFVEGGRIAVGGELPICTDGGTLSFSQPGSAQMLQKVVAGVEQMRGRCGDRQVAGAEVALITNGGAGALFTDVLLLGAGG